MHDTLFLRIKERLAENSLGIWKGELIPRLSVCVCKKLLILSMHMYAGSISKVMTYDYVNGRQPNNSCFD